MKFSKNILLIVSLISAFIANGINCGAGILAYARHPKNGQLCVVLSREAFGVDKNKWADFGGGEKPSEKNKPELTAAREAREESINLVNIKPHLLKNMIHTVYRKYTMYFAKIKFNPHINKQFLARRAKVRKFENREKSALIWLPLIRLKAAIRKNERAIRLHNGQVINIRPFTFAALRSSINVLNRLK